MIAARAGRVQVNHTADADVGPGAPANNIQLGPPEQAFHPGPDPWPEPALLLHRHQLQVRLITPEVQIASKSPVWVVKASNTLQQIRA